LSCAVPKTRERTGWSRIAISITYDNPPEDDARAYEEAIRNAGSTNELRLNIKLNGADLSDNERCGFPTTAPEKIHWPEASSAQAQFANSSPLD
jgi:hypothetical protein